MVVRTAQHEGSHEANKTGQKHCWAPSGSFLLNEPMVKPPLYSGGTGGICCLMQYWSHNLKYLQPKCNSPVCFPPFSF